MRALLEIAGVSVRLGIDVGDDKPTGWMNEKWARTEGFIQPHERLLPNVHGLMVIEDDAFTKFPIMAFQGVVTADPNALIQALIDLDRSPVSTVAMAPSALRIMNLALASPEPLSQIVLAFSAIEELGQNETSTPAQSALLHELAVEVGKGFGHVTITGAERQEVAASIGRSLHKLGLRQGVVRVLRSYGMNSEVKEWDRLYALLSGHFHGTARLSEQDEARLAFDSQTICGRIILTIAKKEGVSLPSITATHFGPV
ncbi:hypothetical protein LZ518_10570 [Sphingomonas sp. RB56-2]|uniref:Uncharacterized protein n=1 Tax=Sphingomonas brevis TaxID=2908206 RepID=A0ABT0SBW3_9SPHN|nr:hypothetical protein [Sphingomonas brevis]MCL6741575.1 hypothetical protein [Sphingomonas brevis]